jgi:hypothetical protein
MSRILLLTGLTFVTITLTQTNIAQAAQAAQATQATQASTLWPALEQPAFLQTHPLIQPQTNWRHSSPPPRWGGGY